ncbi:MAG: response regulator [Candidatus Omnitrophica bacterium]|nr:response regulator [Candidatus Omnitrophota bacterium]MBU1871953.1 response regulator [Candidatus Omnitrophota bacterium]
MIEIEEKFKILLVDDEPDFIEPMAFWMRANGYLVSIASSGRQALQMIEDNPPDMVFLDIRMPVMDGIETLRHIREFDQKLPVIIVTAYPTIEYFSKTQELNVSGFFDKDGDFEELRNVVNLTLNTYKKLWNK